VSPSVEFPLWHRSGSQPGLAAAEAQVQVREAKPGPGGLPGPSATILKAACPHDHGYLVQVGAPALRPPERGVC
jgi:hypothetical protein